MKHDRFNQLLEATLSKCVDILSAKSDEYATEDKFHNFKVAAAVQGCSPVTALAGMMAKHTVSVYDLIRRHEEGFNIPRELWDEKLSDSINYLILLSILLQEEGDNVCQ